MYKKSPFNSFSIFLPLFIAICIFFSGVTKTIASQVSIENDKENSMGIVIEESINGEVNPKISAEPDLGDDQTFPFIPGFGKNSGKD